MKKVQELITTGLATIAKLPPNNPLSLAPGKNFVLPLIAHDYPAKTAIMWNAAYTKMALLFPYTINVMLLADPKNLNIISQVFKEDDNYLGGGVGIGFKVATLPFLNEIDDQAKAIGAINLIVKTEHGLKGYNTDGQGYALSLQDKLKDRGGLSGKKIVIIGAGGAGNAVAFALAQEGAKLTIINRTLEKAKELAERINAHFSLSGDRLVKYDYESAIDYVVRDAEAIVNVSSKGTSGELADYSALAPAELPPTNENIEKNLEYAKKIFQLIPLSCIISDITIADKSTPFLAEAERRGHEILDGIPMVINQAVEAFYLLHEHKMTKHHITKSGLKKIMEEAALNLQTT